MGCGEFLVKYILFFANLFFALAGLTLLGIGIATQLSISAITNLIDDSSFQVAPITAMVVGGVVFLVAFFGCCGAIKESNCMLITFSIFMLVLMLVNIVFGTVVFVKKDDVIDRVPTWTNSAFNNNQEAFHELETTFQCCGTIGAISYVNITDPSATVPDSCCATPPCIIIANAYPGCNGVIQEFLRTYGLIIGLFSIIIASVELVSVVFALCLANHVRNKFRRTRY